MSSSLRITSIPTLISRHRWRHEKGTNNCKKRRRARIECTNCRLPKTAGVVRKTDRGLFTNVVLVSILSIFSSSCVCISHHRTMFSQLLIQCEHRHPQGRKHAKNKKDGSYEQTLAKEPLESTGAYVLDSRKSTDRWRGRADHGLDSRTSSLHVSFSFLWY